MYYNQNVYHLTHLSCTAGTAIFTASRQSKPDKNELCYGFGPPGAAEGGQFENGLVGKKDTNFELVPAHVHTVAQESSSFLIAIY